jgi:hypothetical protein
VFWCRQVCRSFVKAPLATASGEIKVSKTSAKMLRVSREIFGNLHRWNGPEKDRVASFPQVSKEYG